ncbi:MAG: hypothetical protein ACLR3T_00100 [Alistipes finegoldii]
MYKAAKGESIEEDDDQEQLLLQRKAESAGHVPVRLLKVRLICITITASLFAEDERGTCQLLISENMNVYTGLKNSSRIKPSKSTVDLNLWKQEREMGPAKSISSPFRSVN